MKIHYNKWGNSGFSSYYGYYHSMNWWWQRKHCDIEPHATFSW